MKKASEELAATLRVAPAIVLFLSLASAPSVFGQIGQDAGAQSAAIPGAV